MGLFSKLKTIFKKKEENLEEAKEERKPEVKPRVRRALDVLDRLDKLDELDHIKERINLVLESIDGHHRAVLDKFDEEEKHLKTIEEVNKSYVKLTKVKLTSEENITESMQEILDIIELLGKVRVSDISKIMNWSLPLASTYLAKLAKLEKIKKIGHGKYSKAG